MSKKQESRFQVGHVYSIEYDDHYSADKSYREEEDATPMRLRACGVLLVESEKMVVLEHGLHVTDKHAQNKRSDRNGILKSAIVWVQHFGKHDAR